MTSTIKLQGKTAFITGGSSGIGLSTAKIFVDSGAQVFICGRESERLKQAIGILGPSCLGIQVDVRSEYQLAKASSIVRQKAGALDILVAAAGRFHHARLGDISSSEVNDVLAVNIAGVISTVQTMLPLMRRGGSIVLIGSSSATRGQPGLSVYGASKDAVRALARSWMIDLADREIRVNVVSPGPTETPMLFGSASADEQQRIRAHLSRMMPSKRLGHPDDVARALLFLASDASTMINGAELAVDGGITQC